ALGGGMHGMCPAHPPFRATGTIAVIMRVIEETPRPIREVNPDIPDWLEAIIAKLHAKKPEDRFQTAKELADLLEQHLAHLQQPNVVPRPAPVAVPSVPAKTAVSERVWRQLLDARDYRRRLVQQGSILAGTLLIFMAIMQPDFRVLFFLGLAPLIIAGLVKQRFEVQYKGRRLRLVNSVYEAERLYVDGTLLASGGFGRLVELRATIPEGAGAGDQIRATAFAGVFSFGCRIFVAETVVPAQVINPSVAPNAGPDAVPAPLLARGRRGSRWTTFFWFALAIAALVVVGGVDVETGPGEM